MIKGGYWITEQMGNNALSWDMRKAQGSDLKLWVNPLEHGKLEEIAVGDNIVFEEINDHGNLQRYVGLNALWQCKRNYKPLYVVDNHNLVLPFWMKENMEGATLVHIDQHTDMNPSPRGDKDELDFDSLNVGNFILAAKDMGVVDEVIQVNTEYTLKDIRDLGVLARSGGPASATKLIVDIDLDFWAPEMGIEDEAKSFDIVRQLCEQADVITVATSPYFLDQERAIELLIDIFSSQ